MRRQRVLEYRRKPQRPRSAPHEMPGRSAQQKNRVRYTRVSGCATTEETRSGSVRLAFSRGMMSAAGGSAGTPRQRSATETSNRLPDRYVRWRMQAEHTMFFQQPARTAMPSRTSAAHAPLPALVPRPQRKAACLAGSVPHGAPEAERCSGSVRRQKDSGVCSVRSPRPSPMPPPAPRQVRAAQPCLKAQVAASGTASPSSRAAPPPAPPHRQPC